MIQPTERKRAAKVPALPRNDEIAIVGFTLKVVRPEGVRKAVCIVRPLSRRHGNVTAVSSGSTTGSIRRRDVQCAHLMARQTLAVVNRRLSD